MLGKKSVLILIVIFVLAIPVFATACDGREVPEQSGEFSPFIVEFYSDGEFYSSVEVDSADFDFLAHLPATPHKEDGDKSFVFSHWKYSDGTALTEDNVPESAERLYAVFTEIRNIYTVTFKGFDGNYLAVDGKYSQTIEEGGKAIAPVPEEKEGYTFIGWDVAFDNVRSDLTVNALYEKNSYELTFVSMDKVVKIQKAEFGSDIGRYTSEVLVLGGFSFGGWQSEDGQTYKSMPAKNLTYTAVWTLKTPEVRPLSASSTETVYGSPIEFTAQFVEYENINYSVKWIVDGTVAPETGQVFSMKAGAGSHSVQAVVTASFGNMTTSFPTVGTKVTVFQKELSVMPVATKLIYGEEYVPQFEINGFVDGEDESVLSGTLDADTEYYPGKGTGEYRVVATGVSSSDYKIYLQSAVITVLKRPVTVIPDDASVIYGSAFEPSGYKTEGMFSGDDSSVVFGNAALGCLYNAGDDVGQYEIYAESGFTSDNYSVSFLKGTLTVSKKDAVIAAEASAEKVYFMSDVPAFNLLTEGLCEEFDRPDALGEITLTTNYVQGAPAGEYYVQAIVTKEGKNYRVESAAPVCFEVLPLEIGFEGNEIKDNRFGTGIWSGNAADFVTGLPQGFVVEGVLSSTVSDTGEYTLRGYEISDEFDWIQPFRVVKEGEDYTSSFELRYDFKLILGATADISLPNYSADYNKEPQGAGVTVNDAGYYVEYIDAEGGISSEYPLYTDAGEYEVFFRVVNSEGAVLIESSYTIVINRIYNEIDFSGIGSYTYNGGQQHVTGAKAVYENAEISYIGNTFTDVPVDGKLTVTVIAEQTKNYLETRENTEISILKADYSEEQIPEVAIEVEVEPGKTLEEVQAPQYFTWYDAAATRLAVGDINVDALYCADSRNYNVAAANVKVTGIKTLIEIIPAEYTISVPYGTQYLPSYYFEKKGAQFVVPEGVTLSVTADRTEFETGSTYRVVLSLENNGWYRAEDAAVIVKVPTVLYSGIYYTIEDALRLTQTEDTYIIVAHDTSFAEKEVSEYVYPDDSYRTLSANENLLVPYSGEFSTNAFDCATGSVIKNNAYVTLYIPEGITFKSSGYVYVAATRNVASAQPTGNTSGKYGVMNIAQGGTFVSDGTFESLGFTVGEGLVEITGGNIYEPMISIGYKGGNITNSIRDKVFPINQYTLNNIIADMKINHGVFYYAKAAVGADGKNIYSDVKFLGTESNDFMQLNSGYIFKSYNSANGVVRFDVYGDINFNDMSLKLEAVLGISVTVSTEGKQVPLPGYFDFSIMSGNAVVNSGVKLLPGTSFTVENGATLTVNSDLFVYSSVKTDVSDTPAEGDVEIAKKDYAYENTVFYNGWQDGGNGIDYPLRRNYNTANYYYTAVTFDFDGTTPAVFTVRGTLNVSSDAAVAGAFNIEGEGRIVLNSNAKTSNTIKEDLSNYKDQILQIVQARYFTSTAKAYFVNVNGKGEMTAGATYTAASAV